MRNAYKLIKSDREYTSKIGIKHDMPKRRARKDLKQKKGNKDRTGIRRRAELSVCRHGPPMEDAYNGCKKRKYN